MLTTPGPWRVADYDDCQIYSADGDAFVGSIAQPENGRVIAKTPEMLDLIRDLATCACTCADTHPCFRCRAQGIVASLEYRKA